MIRIRNGLVTELQFQLQLQSLGICLHNPSIDIIISQNINMFVGKSISVTDHGGKIMGFDFDKSPDFI